jgi:adenine/guanine phosphoribosyltransferase-like PRPP-binding protein
MVHQDVLFVLSQDKIVIEAITKSKFIKIFKNIIFIEKELYELPEEFNKINLQQPLGDMSFIICAEKLKSFIKSIIKDDKLKNIPEENIYVLAIEKYIGNNNTSEQENNICEYVNVELYHKELCNYVIGSPANFPQKYFDELNTVSNKILNEVDGKQIILGYDKKISEIIAKNENCDENEWVNKFNDFNNLDQITNVVNSLNFDKIVLKDISNNNLVNILANNTHKQMLKDILIRKFLSTESLRTANYDCVIGVEGNGNIYGMMLADLFNIPFIPFKNIINTNINIYNTNILVVDECINTGKTIYDIAQNLKKYSLNNVNYLVLTENTKSKQQLEELQEFLEDEYKKVHILFSNN